MYETPFKTLKERAKRALDQRIARCDPLHGAIGFDGEGAARLLIPFALLDDEARTALRALVRAGTDHSPLALRAQTHARAGLTDWSQWLLCARRSGHRLIDGWDVRCVAHLITHLPECVPSRQRRAAIACRLAEDSGEWVVAFAGAQPAVENRP